MNHTVDPADGTLTGQPIAASHPQLTTLTDTFAVPFHLWDGQNDSSAGTLAVAEHARQHGFAIQVLDEASTQVWIVLPGRRGYKPLAVGTLPSRDPQLLELLIRAARHRVAQERMLSEQSADVESCLESLTYGLEEQTWLRSLTSHMTLCSLRHTWHDGARAILPTLRSLVRADSLVLLAEAVDPHTHRPDMASEAAMHLSCEGARIVDDHSWNQWREARKAAGETQALVQNGLLVDSTIQRFGIHALCAIPIIHREHHFGWLVAIKRGLREADRLSRPTVRLSEEEFGTIEAGLMEAAASMLATHRSNVDLLQDRENLTVGIIRAMGNAIDARDPYTRGHSERVGRYGRLLARAIGLSPVECDRLYLSGLLHDVGKIGIPDTVLQKPGKLTDEEFAIIKQHPEIGARIVSTLPQLVDLLPGILHHHENIDGTGYPHGLVGEAIPLMGRILAVADAYDAMTSDRPYRQGMSRERAAGILASNAGVQWDERLVNAFLAIPHEHLKMDAGTGVDGWKTDEISLRGGTASLYGNDPGVEFPPLEPTDANSLECAASSPC